MWLGVALHSELGAQMAPKKPRPLQAASGKRTPQRLEAMPLLTGDQRVKLETGDGDYMVHEHCTVLSQKPGDPPSLLTAEKVVQYFSK